MRGVVATVALAVAVATSTPATAARTGVIEGRVVNETRDRPQAGALVELTVGGTRADTLRARTDDRGRFRFDDLATGEDVFYAVDVTYDGGLFPGSPLTIPDDTEEEPVIETTTRVWDTTTDPAAILVRSHDVFVVAPDDQEQGRRGVSVLESLDIVNPTDLAYIGRGAGRTDARAPTLGMWLPEDADPASVSFFDSTIDIPEVVETDFGFGITTAVPPGATKVTYGYTVAGNGGTYDITKRVLYPTSELAIFATRPLTLEADRLTAVEGIETIAGRTYRRWDAPDDLDPSDSVQVLAVAEAGTSVLFLGIGVAAAIVLLVALGLWLLRRRSRAAVPEAAARDRLLEEIARLDVERAAGRLDESRWKDEREALKRKVRDLPVGSGR